MIVYLFIGLLMLPVILVMVQRDNDKKRGWRMFGIGRDEMKYEEYDNGRWIGVVIYAELEGWNSRRVFVPEKFEGDAIHWSSERQSIAHQRIVEYSKQRKWSIIDERGEK